MKLSSLCHSSLLLALAVQLTGCEAPGPAAEPVADKAPAAEQAAREVAEVEAMEAPMEQPVLADGEPLADTALEGMPEDAANDAAALADSEPFSVDGWGEERIELPPGFAPDLPSGVEVLLFAPGWRDANAPDYWSYVFVMAIDEPAPSAERLDEIFELYYDGLIKAVAKVDVGDDPAQVEVQQIAQGHYEAEIHLIDGFVTQKPLDLNVEIRTEGEISDTSFVHVLASPRPRGDAVWQAMEAALATIEL